MKKKTRQETQELKPVIILLVSEVTIVLWLKNAWNRKEEADPV